MGLTTLGKVLLFLVTTTTVLAEIQINASTATYFPKQEYLQKWTKNIIQAKDIPKCVDLPKLSDEERNITSKCPQAGKNDLCSNIFLISEVREMCRPFLENLESFRECVREIIEEVGLEDFASMPMKLIVERLEEQTKIEIPNFIRRDVDDVVMDVLDEIALAAGFTKKEPGKDIKP